MIREAFLLLFSAVIIISSPALTFAYSRQELVSQTLTRIETTQIVQRLPAPSVPQTDSEEMKAIAAEYPYPEAARTAAKAKAAREAAMEKAFYVSGAFDANQIHYSEWDADTKLDEDIGHHTGFYVAIGYKSPYYYDWLMGSPFVELYYRRFKNRIRYKGAIIGGGPFNADQRSDVQEYGGKIGAYRNVFDDLTEVKGYIDIGNRIWDRGENEIIDGVRMYAEKYTWVYAGFGAAIARQFHPRLSIGIEGEWLFTVAQSRKMYADDIGYGDLTYKLGNVWGVKAKVPIKYRIFRNLTLDVTPYFDYWSIKHSNYIPIGGGFYLGEPDSRTHLEGLLAGLTYSF